MSEDGSDWYYAVGSQQNGPVPADEVAALVRAGAIGPETLVWTRPMPAWARLRETRLAGLLAPPSPPPAPPPPPAFAMPPPPPPPAWPVPPPPPSFLPHAVAPVPPAPPSSNAPADPPFPAPAPSFLPVQPLPPAPPAPEPLPAEPKFDAALPLPASPETHGSEASFAPREAPVSTATPPAVAPSRSDGPIRYAAEGSRTEVLTVQLEAGEQLRCRTGRVLWTSGTIRREADPVGGFGATSNAGSHPAGSLSVFTAEATGSLALAPARPGAILVLRLEPGQSLRFNRDAFLCAEPGVDLSDEAADAGGTDTIALRRASGPGLVWFGLPGDTTEKELAPGERLLVRAGHLGLADSAVACEPQGSVVAISGPGRAWLATVSMAPTGRAAAEPSGGPSGAFGSFLGGGRLPDV